MPHQQAMIVSLIMEGVFEAGFREYSRLRKQNGADATQLMEGAGRAMKAARLREMEELGLNPRRFRFLAGFGREIEYYTGFTFQIEADTPEGAIVVAGGGRYDNLLADMGAKATIPAVGCAIHTDRLKAVLQ